MTTFDLVQVQDYLAGLDKRMRLGQNGSGGEHSTLATTLRDHAELCGEFTEKVREWRRAVFGAWIEFDPKVESVWLTEGARLSNRAADLRGRVAQIEAAGQTPEGLDTFQAAVERMDHLLKNWRRPQLAVGPSARHRPNLSAEVMAEAHRRIAALPPLPADWPFTEEQRRAMGLRWGFNE